MRRPDVQYAWNGSVALAYQVVGDAPRDLLVIVGYLSNIEYAWHLPDYAAFHERLASFSRLILMDRRGTGLSDRFGADDAPPLETTMDDILAVLDAAGSAKSHVLGIYDGSQAAMLFAATHGDRVSSLSLYAGGARGTDPELSWDDQRWDSFLSELRAGWGTRTWTVKALRWQAPSMLDDAAAIERWITMCRLSASPSSAVATLQVERHTDVSDILPAIAVPTLVLHRSGDQAEPISSGRFLAERIPGARFVELDGDDTVPWIGDAASVLDEIEAHVTGQVKGPATPSNRVLATVLFTDIVGSTAKAAELGDDAWRGLIAEHDRLARAAVEDHRGRLIRTMGDGLLATFDGPARAVRCAQAIGLAVSQLGLEIRAGCHTGEIELLEDDLGGIAVHIGARVAAMAGAGEVWASSTVKDLTAGSGLTFEDAGEHDLKGVPDRWHLYRVAGA